MAIIYKIENQINHKVYIGKTIRTLAIRKQEHLRSYLTKDTKLYRAMRKYGINNFSFSILESNISENDISQKEQEYIKKYNSYYDGYNSTFGGEGESTVDFSIIEKLFLEGKNCSDIEKITGYTKKTIAARLKANGYKIQTNKGLNSQGKNNCEVKILFNDIVYNSISQLALYLQENVEIFKDKKKATIIQGISRCVKKNNIYCGYKFYLYKE